MHFACMQPAGALLTTGWALSFGSPHLTGQYLAAGGASSCRGAEFDMLFQARFLKGAKAPLWVRSWDGHYTQGIAHLHDCLYPTFRGATQAECRLGGS
jgi:hypothetical protein